MFFGLKTKGYLVKPVFSLLLDDVVHDFLDLFHRLLDHFGHVVVLLVLEVVNLVEAAGFLEAADEAREHRSQRLRVQVLQHVFHNDFGDVD